VPWSQHNIPVLPSTIGEVTRIIKEKIASGVYEPSTAAYHSRWFCIVKKDGKSLHLVHDLQPLNTVTIRDASVPPFVEHLTESFVGYAIYDMMDLYSGYDQRALHVNLRDLTTFSTPLGPHRLTTLPQGHTNAAQIFQGDVASILQDKIPKHTLPFIDDIAVKSVETCYENDDGIYELIAKNQGICRFVWEHLRVTVMNRILQRLQNLSSPRLAR
jgi:hypothetical protein